MGGRIERNCGKGVRRFGPKSSNKAILIGDFGLRGWFGSCRVEGGKKGGKRRAGVILIREQERGVKGRSRKGNLTFQKDLCYR